MNKITKQFKLLYDAHRLGHAFLIGNTTIGECKDDLSDAISKYLFEDKINIMSNPEIYIIEPEDGNISKRQIKDLLVNLSTTSLMTGKKIYIITECENLSDNVYNSLLKTIEEPGENVYAILITSNIDNVGNTIKSRCQTIFVSSNACVEFDEEARKTARIIIDSIELNGINSIAKNSNIYSLITNKDMYKKIVKEMFHIYIDTLLEKISSECDKIIDNYCKKILVINGIIEKNNININKDLSIDKLIIELWRCNNENSIGGI